MKTRSCLTCARFTNYRSALLCGDINTRIPKEVDISKGCDRWIEKGDTNWYFMPSEEGFLKKELRIEEDVYNEFMNGNNPYDRMDEERLELAENIKWRRVLECAYLEKRD